MKTARELIKKLKVGDVVKFEDNVVGIVISPYGVKKRYHVVDGKAILLTNDGGGKFYGDLCEGYWDVECEKVDVNAIVIR